jgi:hypothetical protein
MLMADYRQTLRSAVFRFPLRAAFALLPCRAERLGHETRTADHGDRAWLAEKSRIKAWLSEHYAIQAPTAKAP